MEAGLSATPGLAGQTPCFGCQPLHSHAAASEKRRADRGKGCGWLRRAQGRMLRPLAARAALELATPWHTSSYWPNALRPFTVF